MDFKLIAREPDTFYFDGVTVQRRGPDCLREVVINYHKDGAKAEAEFTYQRVR